MTPAIHSLAARARDQIRAGIAELHAGNPLACEVFLRAATATVQSLVALLGEPPPPAPPIRKLCVVGPNHLPAYVDKRRDDETLPEWMNEKKGGPDGAA